MQELEFLVLFVYDDANFGKTTGRLDFPSPLLEKPRCTSGKCKKRNKCLFHKLPAWNNGRIKECGGYIKFKYPGEIFPGINVFDEDRYLTDIYPWILKAYKKYYGYPDPEEQTDNYENN